MDEEMDVVEEEAEPLLRIQIWGLPLSTLREFQSFARAYAGGKYAVAIRLLVDRSTILEQYGNLERRIRALENHVAGKDLNPESEEKRGRRTFGGGRKNE